MPRKSRAPSPAPHQAALERLPVPPGFRFRPPVCAYSIRISGDCMEPVIYAGDVVIVDPLARPEPGQIVIFERACRLFVKLLASAGGGLALVSVNGPEIRIPVDEEVNIVGVVTDVRYPLDFAAPRLVARRAKDGAK